jgi:hypothetical protein
LVGSTADAFVGAGVIAGDEQAPNTTSIKTPKITFQVFMVFLLVNFPQREAGCFRSHLACVPGLAKSYPFCRLFDAILSVF